MLIYFCRSDRQVATELAEGFETEQNGAASVIVSANAQLFCLLVQQHILESQIRRLQDETQLYNAQSREQQVAGPEVNAVQMEEKHLLERIRLLEHQVGNANQESEFYIKQVQEVEKNVFSENARLAPVALDRATTAAAPVAATTVTQNTSPWTQSYDDLREKQKQLEDAVSQEQLERDALETKVRLLLFPRIAEENNEIAETPRKTVQKPAAKSAADLQNTSELLEQQVSQLQGEKDLLLQQMHNIKGRHAQIHEELTKLLQKHFARANGLRKRCMLYEQRLGKLTYHTHYGSYRQYLDDIKNAIQQYLKTHATVPATIQIEKVIIEANGGREVPSLNMQNLSRVSSQPSPRQPLRSPRPTKMQRRRTNLRPMLLHC